MAIELHGFELAERMLEDARARLGRAPRSVLDAGCASGHLVRAWNPVPGMEKLEAERLPFATWTLAPSLRGRFVAARADRLPFRDDEFEVVALLEGLERWSDPTRLLGELARVTSRLLLLAVPRPEEATGGSFPLEEAAREAGLIVIGWHPQDEPRSRGRSIAGRLLPSGMRRMVRGALVTTGLMAPRPRNLGAVLAKPYRRS